jgi:hypothetical protein
MPLFLIVIGIGVIGGIIGAIGAILALGFGFKVGLYITILGAIIVIIEFIIDEWNQWKGRKNEE